MAPRLIATLLVLLTACSVGCTIQSALARSDRVITLMAYNVENLFDAVDNPNNPGDDTYIPLAKKDSPAHRAFCEREYANSPFYKKECLELDWSEDVVSAKLKNLAAVISGFNGGSGPDILVLQEVENLSILKRLVQSLANSGA